MSYTRDEFAKLRYNTFDLKKGDSLDFADLPNYPVFTDVIKGIDSALLFKWISYMYDQSSPLINIADIRKRGLIAANECHFPKIASGKLNLDYRKVAIFDRSIMVKLGAKILEYCRLQRDPDYLQLAVFEMRRVFNNIRLIDPDTETKESLELIKAQGLLSKDIDELRAKFLNGDDSDKTYSEVLDSIENDNMEFSPEQILLNEKIRQAIAEHRPFGKNYKFDKYNREDLNDEEESELQDELNNNTEECRTHFKSLGLNEISGS